MDSYEATGQSCQEMSSKIVEVEVNEKDTCKDNWDFIILMKEYLSNVLGSDLQGRVVVHTILEWKTKLVVVRQMTRTLLISKRFVSQFK